MIVPALLTDKKEDLVSMTNKCSQFCDYVQIDIMDGKLVPSKSIGLLDLEGWKAPLRCEAHLMVCDPVNWIEPFKRVGAEKIIYHFEAKPDHLKVIAKIREAGLRAGIAINPSTQISEIEFLIKEVDTFLFMSVNPGFYGANFIPQVLGKIKSFKSEHPDKFVGIDGGIKLDNLLSVKDAGTDYVCVGSAILKKDNSAQAYSEFVRLSAKNESRLNE